MKTAESLILGVALQLGDPFTDICKYSGGYKGCVDGPGGTLSVAIQGSGTPLYTVCPGSSDPFYIVTYYKKWVTTSWTYCILEHYILYIYFYKILIRHFSLMSVQYYLVS